MTKIQSWFMGSLKSLGLCFHSSAAHTDCLLCSGSSTPLLLLFWAASHWSGIFKMLMSAAATRLHITSIFSRAFFREPTQLQTSSPLYDLCVPTKLVPLDSYTSKFGCQLMACHWSPLEHRVCWPWGNPSQVSLLWSCLFNHCWLHISS